MIDDDDDDDDDDDEDDEDDDDDDDDTKTAITTTAADVGTATTATCYDSALFTVKWISNIWMYNNIDDESKEFP